MFHSESVVFEVLVLQHTFCMQSKKFCTDLISSTHKNRTSEAIVFEVGYLRILCDEKITPSIFTYIVHNKDNVDVLVYL